MSHGPCGRAGATLDAVPAGCAIVMVAPASGRASANMSAQSILVFIVILYALPIPASEILMIWDGNKPVKAAARAQNRFGANLLLLSGRSRAEPFTEPRGFFF